MASPTVRPASAADLPEIARVVNLAFRVEDHFVHGDRTTVGQLAERMAQPGVEFLVVDSDTPGALAAAVVFEARADHGYFGMLSVDPALHGRGIARLLIESMEARCRELGLTTLRIDIVNLRHELPAFYARFGFVEVGRKPFPDPEKLKQVVEMVVMEKEI
jgi:N-acetylglutamate synthase-like GNAT family acetyltransferase